MLLMAAVYAGRAMESRAWHRVTSAVVLLVATTSGLGVRAGGLSQDEICSSFPVGFFLPVYEAHGTAPQITCDPGPPQLCTDAYPYRHPAARAAFNFALDRLRHDCPVLRSARKDPPVNHPDTSEAWVFEYDTLSLRYSYKDKSNLAQTLVTWERRRK